MDLVQIGKFIAQLRKEHEFSQEKLGEILGVTNKTISRWETGTYLPPAEMLVSMSNLFHVTINELLSGKRLTQDEYKIAAEENLRQVVKASSFTLKEKIAFYKKKWLKEHIAAMCCWGIGIITVPPQHAQKICDRLVNAGIKAIWNFANVVLEVPDDIIVQNENMASSLAILSNKLKEVLY